MRGAKRSDREHSLSLTLLILGSVARLKTCPPVLLGNVELMAFDELDIPKMAVVGVQDDNNPSSPSPTAPSPSLDSPHSPPPPPPTDVHGYLSPVTPILRSARNSQDPL